MSLGFTISGANGIPVNSTTENELLIAPTTNSIKSGFVSLVGERDNGSVLGYRTIKEVDVSKDYRLRTGSDQILFNEVFPGTALDTSRWTAPVSTMTVTIAGGFANLNAGLSTASGAVARLQTWRSFPALVTFPVSYEMFLQASQPPVANNVCEWGAIICTGTSAPTDGAFFRLNASGEFRCIINNSGTELQSDTIDPVTYLGVNIVRHFVIEVANETVSFWIDDILVAELGFSGAGATTTSSMNLPLCIRNYNSNATAAAQVLKIGNASVNMQDNNVCRPWPLVMCGAGQMGYQGQAGATLGTTAQYANSTTPAAATPTNTTAALGSGLGGIFQANALGTAATDYIISSYQVPAGTAALPGRSLYITGVKISSLNVGAAVATTSTTLLWSLAFGHTSVSLATTESATAKAPRRVPLGTMNWPIGAAIGSSPDRGDLYMKFTCPIVVQPGEFVQTVAKFLLGTATASQVITNVITFDCFWE